jgi:hypothetical protein
MDNVIPMIVRGTYYGALGVWMGMMVMISLGAPVVFRAVPDRSQAGDVVGGWLGVYYKAALVCAVLVAIASVYRMLNWERGLWQGGWCFAKAVAAARTALLALMILNLLYAGWHLDPEIHHIRASFPDLAALPASDPAKAAFDLLHRRSVTLMGLNLLAGAGVIFLS